jgi:hypothetical protein
VTLAITHTYGAITGLFFGFGFGFDSGLAADLERGSGLAGGSGGGFLTVRVTVTVTVRVGGGGRVSMTVVVLVAGIFFLTFLCGFFSGFTGGSGAGLKSLGTVSAGRREAVSVLTDAS